MLDSPYICATTVHPIKLASMPTCGAKQWADFPVMLTANLLDSAVTGPSASSTFPTYTELLKCRAKQLSIPSSRQGEAVNSLCAPFLPY
jgi:hypothetical protein